MPASGHGAQGRDAFLADFIQDICNALSTTSNSPSPPSTAASVVEDMHMAAAVSAPVVDAWVAGAVHGLATATAVPNTAPSVPATSLTAPSVSNAIEVPTFGTLTGPNGPTAPVTGGTWVPIGGTVAVGGTAASRTGAEEGTGDKDRDTEGEVDEKMEEGL
ncbi:hypothetical protein EST38_g9293 [Candolleomyces aberdarensis]|uniref:Uncharacterized protein n=1 Tax=Candolleomyces aberdarensis TaxID=2316362 RepID=A0A4Q2DA99_9AGAR|nr:hypothetical protein EST38_g9293 [Candolleomyces aberdarensis]